MTHRRRIVANGGRACSRPPGVFDHPPTSAATPSISRHLFDTPPTPPINDFAPALALVCRSLGLHGRGGLVPSLGLVPAAVALAIGIAILWLAVRAVSLLLGG